ncbi:alpha/beta-Hydrolases superfamily protein [Rhynchospora pubera]|uniref:Alpha/beta-Hydrolases superfamily protein n=1 Tax=Rhynchospora pubera TaxID=906938 RepID=A0AAV8DEG7_9POAL|nr:alpha/beta-Hydrolases superfamily protein [Rhynchospora pubera]
MVHPIAEANEQSLFGNLTAEEFYLHHSITHSTSSFTNSEGLRIFTQSWVPTNIPSSHLLGTIAVVHGYTGDSNWTVQLTAVHLAKAGFAVAALDHRGHGFSDGLRLYIPDINPVVDDCVTFFDEFRAKYPPSLPCFLYAESLGGAIALLLHLRSRDPEFARLHRGWDGAILNGAMCGVSAKIKPPWPLEHLLGIAKTFIPTWRVAITRGNIPDLSFKVEWKKKLVMLNPNRIVGNARAGTAYELLRVCRELQSRFEEITIPLLIVHGEDDRVCDPACAEELYKRVSSKDKTLRMHPDMWHQLVGEPDDSVELVFNEMIDWLKSRSGSKESADSGVPTDS